MKTPPHSYIPDGPIETAPYLGYERPEIRNAAFAAVLEGVELGANDTRMVNRPGFCRGSIERTIGSWQERLRTRRR